MKMICSYKKSDKWKSCPPFKSIKQRRNTIASSITSETSKKRNKFYRKISIINPCFKRNWKSLSKYVIWTRCTVPKANIWAPILQVWSKWSSFKKTESKTSRIELQNFCNQAKEKSRIWEERERNWKLSRRNMIKCTSTLAHNLQIRSTGQCRLRKLRRNWRKWKNASRQKAKKKRARLSTAWVAKITSFWKSSSNLSMGIKKTKQN